MTRIKMLSLVVPPLLALGACNSLSDQDRALLNSASQNAEAAKQQAAQAAATAQQALAAAQAAEADAKSANEKADRMFQRSLRK
ncbi:hypothetical protein GCM10011611_27260 [Aliidongia dinghuensis]|uniref:Lipoprotein n=1 Tax=Aliidongia dinghuensis TaxID=1867774 RepID=A0A8J3E3M1_9PROT|nr:alanine-zipper protein [Aliidongia dinghuensis]GGF19824.1 hypothetical protein GCM10011611_27260 [Aliidongia dinghuensis]